MLKDPIMTRHLRKGLTSYGDAGFSLFLRKAFIKAMGFSDDALDRPIVGITNTYSDFNPCHGNVPDLIEAAKRGIMLAGGLPMVFPTISIHESFAYPTSMFLRNLMAMDTEEMIRAQPMDAVIVIGGCDKTIPAQVMAAASVDLPTIVVPTGPMTVGHHKGEMLGACTDCRRMWGSHRAGTIDQAEIDVINNRLAPSVGTCMVMGTASTMACITEAMGLALPLSAASTATSADRKRIAEASGRRATEMAILAGRSGAIANAVAGCPLPSDLITPKSVHNALVVLQAIGGSTNGVIHLTAMAGRAGVKVELDALDKLGREVPVLLNLKPSGEYYMEHFHNAGGVPWLMRELQQFLHLDAPSVSGGTIRDMIAAAEEVPGQDVIKPLDKPLKKTGALAVLRGNLAPRGAVIKQSAASKELMQYTGRAVVFDSVEDMTTRIDTPDLDVKVDDILVLRNAGPKGAPGMPEAGYMPIPLKLARAGVKDMIRISDARMSGTAFGTIVLHITPEAAEGGPLAIVKTGDTIRLDVEARRIDLLVDDAEIQKRLATWRALPPHQTVPKRGYAKLFATTVTQADEGCDFDFMLRDGQSSDPDHS
jgi:dihydroxy-acid dehydratase